MLCCFAVWPSRQCVFYLAGPLPSTPTTVKVSIANPGCQGACAQLGAKAGVRPPLEDFILSANADHILEI